MPSDTKTYQEETYIDNTIRLRGVLNTMPDFARDYFRAIEPTTSPKTRISYAYDIRLFFQFLIEENPVYKHNSIKDFQIQDLEAIQPVDIEEYLEYQHVHLTKFWELSPMKTDILRLFSDYFYYGGLSEVFNIQDKKSWLQSLYQKILYSDIVIRKGVRNERSLRLLIRKLADSVMQPTAIKRLQNILQGDGTKIARETIASYLDYLHESFLTFSISSFTDSIYERETIKKHYFYDNGILNLFLFQPETKLWLYNFTRCMATTCIITTKT